MTARDDAIEAGAAASYERHRAERPDLGLKPWAESGPNMRRSCLAEAAAHYDAMAPLIERATLIAAGQKLRDWADEKYPEPFGPTGTRRRAILASARRIEPEPTEDEISAALTGLLGGMAAQREAEAK